MMSKWQSLLLAVTLAAAVSATGTSTITPYTEAKLVDPNDQGQGSCKAEAKGTLKDLGPVDTACQVSWSDDKKKVKGSYTDTTPFSSVSGSWWSCASKTVHSETIQFADKQISTKTKVDHCGKVTITVDVPADLKCEKKDSKWVCKAQLDGIKCDGKKVDSETPGSGGDQDSSTPPSTTTPPSTSTPTKQKIPGGKGGEESGNGGGDHSSTPDKGKHEESSDGRTPKKETDGGKGSGSGNGGGYDDHSTPANPGKKDTSSSTPPAKTETPSSDKPGKSGDDNSDNGDDGEDADDQDDGEDCEDDGQEKVDSEEQQPGKGSNSGSDSGNGGIQTPPKKQDGQTDKPKDTPGKEETSSTPGTNGGSGGQQGQTTPDDKPAKEVPQVTTPPSKCNSNDVQCDKDGKPLKDGDKSGEKVSPEPTEKPVEKPTEEPDEQPKQKFEDKSEEKPKDKSEDKPKQEKPKQEKPTEEGGNKKDSSEQPEGKGKKDDQPDSTQQCGDGYGKCPEEKADQSKSKVDGESQSDDGDNYGNEKRSTFASLHKRFQKKRIV